MKKCPILLIFSILTISLVSCKTKTEKQPTIENTIKLGEVFFPIVSNEEAKPAFKEGLLLLHSFEYEDAREAFIKAQKADPSCAMAYWGEAMTYNHSLWQRQEKEDGLAALEKLGATPEERLAKTTVELEQDFMKGVEIIYGPGTKYERDLAYSEYMQSLTEKYPDNHEVKAFYAISLLGSSRNGRDEKLYGKSAKIAQSIMAENPSHPGALHYLIHSFDDPGHAHLAKTAADNYSKVAPDAAHALHMPSHIYVALGAWNDVVTSNIASWNASVKRKEKKELDTYAYSYHALNWLQYGLLQRGELEKATRLVNDMNQYSDDVTTKVSRSYMVAMKGAHMVETDSWDGAIADITLDVSDLPITKQAGNAFLEGMKAYHKNDAKTLKTISSDLAKSIYAANLTVGEKGFAMCSAAGFASKPPSQLDVDMATVMEQELQAYLASLNGDKKKAKSIFQKAADLDNSLSYSYGPPTILKPIHEAYAEWLLDEGHTEESVAIFKAALNRNPRRLRSLQGLKKAMMLLDNKEELIAIETEITKSLKVQDRDVIM